MGSSLSEIYSFFKGGGAAMYLDTALIELVGIEECKNIFKNYLSHTILKKYYYYKRYINISVNYQVYSFLTCI